MMAQREAEAPGGGEALSRRDFLKAAWLLALGSAGAAAGFFGLDTLFNEGKISKEVIFAVQTAWENATKKTQGGVDTGAIATETATEEFKREFTVTAVEAGVDTPTITATLENTPIPTLTPTETPAPTETSAPTEVPVKEYPRVSSLENFRDCYVPSEELFNGDYCRYLQSLIPEVSLWFKEHEGVRRTDWEVKPVTGGEDFDLLIFNTPTSPPHFEVTGSTPFHREVTFGHTTVGDILYILYPVFYLHEGNVHPVIYATRIYDENRINRINQTYMEQNQTTTIMGPDYWGRDPLVGRTWQQQGKAVMDEKMNSFMEEDLSALDGLVLLTEIARTDTLK